MDAEAALADLVDVSRDVDAVAIVVPDGGAVWSRLGDESAQAFGTAVRAVVEAAEELKPGDEASLTRLQVQLPGEALVIVRDGDRLAAATAGSAAPLSVVAHDLAACVQSLDDAAVGEAADAHA